MQVGHLVVRTCTLLSLRSAWLCHFVNVRHVLAGAVVGLAALLPNFHSHAVLQELHDLLVGVRLCRVFRQGRGVVAIFLLTGPISKELRLVSGRRFVTFRVEVDGRSCHLLDESLVKGHERGYDVLGAVDFFYQFVITLCQLVDFFLGGVLRAGEEELTVVGVFPQVLQLLLAVQHLPALDAEDLAVGLVLDERQSLDEGGPFGRV